MSEQQESNPEQPRKVELQPCPCGKTPGGLLIEMPERAKYGAAMGDCCGMWIVEFRNGYATEHEITLKRAQDAWNNAPRPSSLD
ncbi:MAG: hypothetical protein AMJ84_04530 [Acidithiobacillales bacterium SM23_46]|nr:MAG: hypothetical protein AMJ84_04530 [Acidithiobacillales bacterium SM23_46]